MKKDKNKKDNDWDDGRTVSPMSAEWMPWNHGMKSSRQSKKENRNSSSEDTDKKQKIELSKAEKRGLLIGALRAFAPLLLCLAFVAVLMYFFARLWLG